MTSSYLLLGTAIKFLQMQFMLVQTEGDLGHLQPLKLNFVTIAKKLSNKKIVKKSVKKKK